MTDTPRLPAATSSPPRPTTSVRRLPELTRSAMWITALVIAVLTAAAVVALWWPATAGLIGADLVKARLDALKIGLSIGVGSGGVVALYLAWRRQHSTEAALSQQERTADDARADAVERRITELYLKAAELLGSDKAPVRLSGLYALERLAHDNESQRQTIVNVLCAYLRMPYEASESLPDDADAEQREQHRALIQEREVRLTAQRLLSDHLKPGRDIAYWGRLDLDLAGAHLINFNLDDALIGTGIFRNATFVGRTDFTRAVFGGHTDLMGARFTGKALFVRTTFTKGAWLNNAIFNGAATFASAAFKERADFREATFSQSAKFTEIVFAQIAAFGKATFGGETYFHSTTFAQDTAFTGAIFANSTFFVETAFNGRADFGNTHFRSDAFFTRAAFARDALFGEATFIREANFANATFLREASFIKAAFIKDPIALGANFARQPVFTDATLVGKPYADAENTST
ncbi:pentapeptide repeat-containing protein [Amycolatopsis sp. NPDC049868]|uniref:pentapeptide repeat-containing protein n=1 Tax=Amycolatopsis sp. NPDC049868 TaxID=3363934 RepID=UPI00378FA369